LVALREGFGRGGDHSDLGASSRKRAIEAFAVEHQADVLNVLVRPEPSEHRLRVRHLRYALGIDEARHFDASQPSIDQTSDQLEFGLRRQNVGLALQAISRTDVDDFH
jgi:hypothetical protein